MTGHSAQFEETEPASEADVAGMLELSHGTLMSEGCRVTQAACQNTRACERRAGTLRKIQKQTLDTETLPRKWRMPFAGSSVDGTWLGKDL